MGDVPLLALNLSFILKINQSGLSYVSVIAVFFFSAKLVVLLALLGAQRFTFYILCLFSRILRISSPNSLVTWLSTYHYCH